MAGMSEMLQSQNSTYHGDYQVLEDLILREAIKFFHTVGPADSALH